MTELVTKQSKLFLTGDAYLSRTKYRGYIETGSSQPERSKYAQEIGKICHFEQQLAILAKRYNTGKS